MARRRTSPASGAAAAGRRAWPYVLMAWERWQSLTDEEKERYKARAREAAAKGRELLDSAQQQAPGRRKKRLRRR